CLSGKYLFLSGKFVKKEKILRKIEKFFSVKKKKNTYNFVWNKRVAGRKVQCIWRKSKKLRIIDHFSDQEFADKVDSQYENHQSF
uniref:Uncharacterized protein n=1 Tax=Megaselia scalaris TaxID=36166 RepID=T1GEK2_MEGSC